MASQRETEELRMAIANSLVTSEQENEVKQVQDEIRKVSGMIDGTKEQMSHMQDPRYPQYPQDPQVSQRLPMLLTALQKQRVLLLIKNQLLQSQKFSSSRANGSSSSSSSSASPSASPSSSSSSSASPISPSSSSSSSASSSSSSSASSFQIPPEPLGCDVSKLGKYAEIKAKIKACAGKIWRECYNLALSLHDQINSNNCFFEAYYKCRYLHNSKFELTFADLYFFRSMLCELDDGNHDLKYHMHREITDKDFMPIIVMLECADLWNPRQTPVNIKIIDKRPNGHGKEQTWRTANYTDVPTVVIDQFPGHYLPSNKQ